MQGSLAVMRPALPERTGSIDLQARKVVSEDGNPHGYDAQVLALGSVSNDFGIPGLQETA